MLKGDWLYYETDYARTDVNRYINEINFENYKCETIFVV